MVTRRLRTRRSASAPPEQPAASPSPTAPDAAPAPPPRATGGPEEIGDEVAASARRPRSRRQAAPEPDDDGPTSGEGADLVQRLEEEISQPSGLLRACLLLLLREEPGHGYDLHERLKAFGFDRIDASRSYRALHWLERAELAEAHWETDNRGPARRVYQLTPAGDDALDRCVATLQERTRVLNQYVARYRRVPR